MAKVLINDKNTIEGNFTFRVSYDNSQKPPLVSIEGILTSEVPYMEVITRIESERYLLDGVHVHAEEFGSNDKNIAYYFTAKSFAIADE